MQVLKQKLNEKPLRVLQLRETPGKHFIGILGYLASITHLLSEEWKENIQQTHVNVYFTELHLLDIYGML